MTHTLHRIIDEKEKIGDYVMFSMPAKGYNDHEIWERVDKNYNIMHRCNAVNIGGYDSGVFTSKEDLKTALSELKKEDLGVSIIISGNFDDINEVCEDLDIKPHTVEFSIGIFGKKELLPDEKILEITTMCGHGLISGIYVSDRLKKIKKGKTTALKAAKKLGKACYCGVFNPNRAAVLLDKLAADDS
jgi:hypothetical protein